MTRPKISSRTRAEAIELCQAMASSERPSWFAKPTASGLGTSDDGWWLMVDAFNVALAAYDALYSDQPGEYDLLLIREVYAEAEAMLQCGWEP